MDPKSSSHPLHSERAPIPSSEEVSEPPLERPFIAEHLRLEKAMDLRPEVGVESQSPDVSETSVLAYALSLGEEVKGGACGLA